MRRTIGLDLGTASIGWAIVEEENEIKKIKKTGSRIVPIDGQQLTNFKRGQAQTANANRRIKKSIRVGNKRFKQRRNKLLFILKELNLLPKQYQFSSEFNNPKKIQKINILPIDKGEKQLTAKEFNSLILKALKKPVTNEEFGRILIRYNKLRGYSGGNENEGNEDISSDEILEVDRSKNSYPNQETRVAVYKIINVVLTQDVRNKKKVFELDLVEIGKSESEMIKGTTVLKNLNINQEYELKETIRRNTKSSEITSRDFSFFNKSNWRKRMESIEVKLEELSLEKNRKVYISEYFNEILNENEFYQIRENVVLRKRYLEEFEQIWKIQAPIHLNKVSNTQIKKIAHFLFPGEKETQLKYREEAETKGLKYIIKDQVIYYQRPLKDQSHLIANCRFEPEEKVSAKSHPLFEEFKIWDQINRLTIKTKTKIGETKSGNPKYKFIERPINGAVKEKLYQELQKKSELSFSSVFKIIEKLDDFTKEGDFFNGLSSKHKLVGNKSKLQLKKSMGVYWKKLQLEDLQNRIEFWNILYNKKGSEYDLNSERNKAIKDYLTEKIGDFPEIEKVIVAISKIKFPRNYGSISTKTVENVLPLMKAGKYYSQNEIAEEINEKISICLNEVTDDKFQISLQEYLDENPELLNRKGGLLTAYAYILCYGKHTAKEINEDEIYETYDEIKPLKQHSLRNPLVEQMINETLMFVKEVWQKYGKIDEIKVELSRDLKNSIKERAKIDEANRKARKINEAIEERLTELKQETNKKNINKYKLWSQQVSISDDGIFEKISNSKSEIDRLKLWEEQKHIDPYTGKPIKLCELFNDQFYDIDHIIPKSRYFDDSLSNKVITAQKINAEKSNRTPFEYLQIASTQNKLFSKDEFIEHASKIFRGRKLKNLLADKIPEDPIERQKKDTQYISIRVREELAKIVGSKNVYTTTGSVTHHLRNHWGLTALFKKLLLQRYKKFFKLKCAKEIKKHKHEENFNEQEFINAYVNEHIYTKDNNQIIEGYTKRVDHRNHALDALLVAVTDAKVIKRLNNLNKSLQDFLKSEIQNYTEINFNEDADNIIEKYFEANSTVRNKIKSQLKKFRDVKIPWKGFIEDAKQHLDSIIISHKPKDTLLIQPARFKNPNTNEIEIDKTKREIRVRGALHDETIYGLSQNFETKRIPLSKFANSKFDTKGNIEKIVSEELRKIITIHFDDYNSKKSEAFGEEGLNKLNDILAEKSDKELTHKPHKPVKSVKVYLKKEDSRTTVSLKNLSRRNSFNNSMFINTNENYLFAILNDGKKRFFDLLTFFDATNLLKEDFKKSTDKINYNKNLLFKRYFEQKHNAKLLFNLKKLDMVYLPLQNEDLILDSESPIFNSFWKSKDRVNNIFVFRKMSGSRAYFLKHNVAIPIEKNIEFGSQNLIEIYEERNIKDYCIPIKLDRLGNIIAINNILI